MNKDRVSKYFGRLRRAFSPFQPVQLKDLFAGRIEQISRIMQAITNPGQHVIIYGDRGIGKTSLANIVHLIIGNECVIHGCNSEDNFETIFNQLFSAIKIDTLSRVVRESSSYEAMGSLKAGIAVAGGRVSGEEVTSKEIEPLVSTSLNPNYVIEIIKRTKRKIVLIIDEFDRVKDLKSKQKLADVIKLISDANVSCTLVIVGVASSVLELIGEHRSIERSLCQIEMQRMSKVELTEIITKGEKILQPIRFNLDVRDNIVDLSDGLPYYTQLLAYYSANNLIHDESSDNLITLQYFHRGLSEAISNVQESLKNTYENAISTASGKSNRIRNVLMGCAMSDEITVCAKEIVGNVSILEDKNIKISECSYCFGELTKSSKNNILKRVRKGWYKFNDPLMRGFVRLQMMYMNIFEKQIELPFIRSN